MEEQPLGREPGGIAQHEPRVFVGHGREHPGGQLRVEWRALADECRSHRLRESREDGGAARTMLLRRSSGAPCGGVRTRRHVAR